MNRILSVSALLLPALAFSQDRYSTRTGEVSFHSETPMENIDAVNHKATGVIDVTSGQVQVTMLIKAFEFKKALMQDHFNENYMDSNTFPKGEFKGKLVGFTAENATKAGKYEVTLEGELDIHGVKQQRTLNGTKAGGLRQLDHVSESSLHGPRPGTFNPRSLEVRQLGTVRFFV